MLEETLIRESATHKLQQRVGGGSAKVIGPPVTFANPVSAKPILLHQQSSLDS